MRKPRQPSPEPKRPPPVAKEQQAPSDLEGQVAFGESVAPMAAGGQGVVAALTTASSGAIELRGCDLSPPRGVQRTTPSSVSTPLRAEAREFTATRRLATATPLSPPTIFAFSIKQPSSDAISFVKEHLRDGEFAAPPGFLDDLFAELDGLDRVEWQSHLQAAGGSYSPILTLPGKRRSRS